MRRHDPRPREAPFREFTEKEYARQEREKLETGTEILQVADKKQDEEEDEEEDEDGDLEKFFIAEDDADGKDAAKDHGLKSREELIMLKNAQLEAKFAKFESETKASVDTDTFWGLI